MTETSTGINVPVTDEMVETAARAIDHAYNPERHPILAAMFGDYARAALEAAAPAIAATALRDAVDTADEAYAQEDVPLGAYGNGYIDGVGTALDYIRSRADQIKKED